MKFDYSRLWDMMLDEGYSKSQLAQLANVSRYSLSKISAGDSVQIEVLARIATVFTCDLTDLFEVLPSLKKDYQD